jgi:hypothetical protein
VPIELVDALRVDAPIGSLLELMTDPGLETAVLCGHGEQIGGLVRQLADGGLVGDASLRWAKGSTWVLDTTRVGWLAPGTCAAAAQGPRRPLLGVACPSGTGVARLVAALLAGLSRLPALTVEEGPFATSSR